MDTLFIPNEEDYKITDDELLTLTEKIRRIHEILAETGKDFMTMAQSDTPISCEQTELQNIFK